VKGLPAGPNKSLSVTLMRCLRRGGRVALASGGWGGSLRDLSVGGRHGLKPCHYPQIQLFAPSAFGNRPVRPESQPRASRTNRCSARRRTPRSETCARPPRPAPGLKGRFQRSQVRKHLVATPLNTPAGLKGRFQQSEVRKHLGEPYPTAKTADVLKSALQASKPIWGVPRTQGCALGFRKSALQA
jgi:hypothetical protein